MVINVMLPDNQLRILLLLFYYFPRSEVVCIVLFTSSVCMDTTVSSMNIGLFCFMLCVQLYVKVGDYTVSFPACMYTCAKCLLGSGTESMTDTSSLCKYYLKKKVTDLILLTIYYL